MINRVASKFVAFFLFLSLVKEGKGTLSCECNGTGGSVMSQLVAFTASSLQTVSGQSMAVLMVVQILKELPFIKSLPTRALAVIIGILLGMAVASPVPHHLSDFTLVIMNGIVAALTAVGGWHVLQSGGSVGVRAS